MAGSPPVKVGPLKKSELKEADCIFRVAFGTFMGLPNPMEFMGDRDFLISRWHAPHVKTLAARHNGRLIGTNQITRWDRGVAQLLLDATMKVFDKQGLKRTGLFTFAHSAKHVGLYQKFGYWPGYLTALMTHTPNAEGPHQTDAPGSVHLSALNKSRREEAVAGCAKLTAGIRRGLDLGEEIRSVLRQKTGEVVLIYTRNALDGFAICLHGAGSEGGTHTCYVKFAAARSGAGAGVSLEAGMNMAREDAYRRMRAHGFKAFAQGVSMQRPHAPGHNRGDVYVIDDWR